MTPIIFYAVIFFTTALIFYTVGVWSERYSKRLKNWHVSLFFFGVITDAIGTWLMYFNLGYIKITAHTISGFIGFFLMVFHCAWAIYALLKNNEQVITNFHKFSIFVWIIWMVSYISGLILGMQKLFG
jgi:uncharacterized repeat protein (TIGR03987 family)